MNPAPDRSVMRVAVYPGSFNPLHKGHMQVIRHLLDNAGFDRVYLIVSPHNPFKDRNLENSASERFEAAKERIAALGLSHRVLVDDIELGMEGPSYTIRTLDALHMREPSGSFTLVCGSDIVPEFKGWREWRRILKEYGLVVYPRGTHDTKKDICGLRDECPDAKIEFMEDAPKLDMSSTQIRQMISRGENTDELLA